LFWNEGTDRDNTRTCFGTHSFGSPAHSALTTGPDSIESACRFPLRPSACLFPLRPSACRLALTGDAAAGPDRERVVARVVARVGHQDAPQRHRAGAHTHAHTNTQTHTRIHTHTHTHSHTPTYTHTQAKTRTHTQAHTHARTHKHTRTSTHTHAHTHHSHTDARSHSGGYFRSRWTPRVLTGTLQVRELRAKGRIIEPLKDYHKDEAR
jgi:hypothetical protein